MRLNDEWYNLHVVAAADYALWCGNHREDSDVVLDLEHGQVRLLLRHVQQRNICTKVVVFTKVADLTKLVVFKPIIGVVPLHIIVEVTCLNFHTKIINAISAFGY